MTTIINGDSPSITFSDSTTQTTAFNGKALSATPFTTSLGFGALASNTSGTNNTAVGYQAGSSNTTGGLNVYVGYQAGYNISSGSNHVYVGTKAGYLCTATVGNTFVGDNAGSNVTTGKGNTFIGTNNDVAGPCGNAVTTGSYNTIIGSYTGNQGGLDIRTASNYIVLSDGAGNPQAYYDSSRWWLKAAITDSAGVNYQNTQATRPSGIYVATPNATQNNTSEYFLYCNDSTNVKAIIYSNGTIQNRTGTYTTISDAKLKENVVNTSPKLDKLNQVRVVNYNLIGDDLKQVGFVAQELEQVFPSLVFETDDRDNNGDLTGETTKGVKLTVMIPILVKAIQELKAELDATKAEVAALKA